jgi:hypothetical protein
VPLGLLDLSIVTDQLLKLLKDSYDSSNLWAEEPSPPAGTPPGTTPGTKFHINFTGLAPDVIRDLQGCQLSAYLYHVGVDKFLRNSPVVYPVAPVVGPGVAPRRVPPNPAQPLPLELYYLITAFSSHSYIEEQQAMSIALKCLHENSILTAIVPAGDRPQELTITMEMLSVDELSRFWQATTKPIRLAAAYRVSVVFLEPPPPPPLARTPAQINLDASPTLLPFGPGPQVTGTLAVVAYSVPGPGGLEKKTFELSPATAAPSQSLLLLGAGFLTPGTSDHVFLLSGTVEQDITAWVQTTSSATSKLSLLVPKSGAPTAGVYQVRVGNNRPVNDPASVRSNATPVSIAAFVDPSGGITLSGNPINVHGIGFIAGATEVLIGAVALRAAAGAPAAGQFQVVSSTTLRIAPPALPVGAHALRVRVNAVESSPAVWVVT